MRIATALVLAILAGPAMAFNDADRAAVQGAVESQIQAFLRDDAATAYSFAAPGIRAIFPTEDIFMGMVRQAYPQVYRPRSHEFGELTETPTGGLQQIVDLVDAEGVFWTARYTLEKQPDGSWKITSCTIEKKPGEVA